MPRRTGIPAAYRLEHDSMGELRVPADALWGAQTQRALQNFRISGRPMPRGFIRALGLVKAAASYPLVQERIAQACQDNGLRLCDYFDSAITGGDGNREFFVWACP